MKKTRDSNNKRPGLSSGRARTTRMGISNDKPLSIASFGKAMNKKVINQKRMAIVECPFWHVIAGGPLEVVLMRICQNSMLKMDDVDVHQF